MRSNSIALSDRIDMVKSFMLGCPDELSEYTHLDEEWFDSMNCISMMCLAEEVADKNGRANKISCNDIMRCKTVGELMRLVFDGKDEIKISENAIVQRLCLAKDAIWATKKNPEDSARIVSNFEKELLSLDKLIDDNGIEYEPCDASKGAIRITGHSQVVIF